MHLYIQDILWFIVSASNISFIFFFKPQANTATHWTAEVRRHCSRAATSKPMTTMMMMRERVQTKRWSNRGRRRKQSCRVTASRNRWWWQWWTRPTDFFRSERKSRVFMSSEILRIFVSGCCTATFCVRLRVNSWVLQFNSQLVTVFDCE